VRKDVALSFTKIATVPVSYRVRYSVLEAPTQGAPVWEGLSTIPNEEKLVGLLLEWGKSLKDIQGPIVLSQINLDDLARVLRKYCS
jgi:hypothetical protein